MLSKFSACMYTHFFASLSNAKKIAYLAVFIAMSVVMNSLIEINVSPTNKITFTYFVCFFAGFLLGPLPGFLVGFLGDAIGFLIVPQDVYWLFGLTLGLSGALAGICRKLPFRGKGGVFLKACIFFVASYILITFLLNSLVNYSYVYLFRWDKVAKKTFWIYLVGRLAFQSVVYGVNVAVCLAVLGVLVPKNVMNFFKDELSADRDKSAVSLRAATGADGV